MASAPLFCTHCGAANRSMAAFCFACGQPLAGSDPAASAANATDDMSLMPTFDHLLKDRYRVVSQLGRGGMGAVYKAEDTLFGNRVMAVKEMSQGGLSGKQRTEAASDFKREAHMLADLRHSSLPLIHDYFSDSGQWYLVMSFIEGETLQERLEREPGGWLPLKQALSVGLQLCTVLDYLHTRQPPIIFRDLKPANVMLTSSGELFLIDFGIARHFKPGQLKDTATFGSAGYAAPEQYGKSQTTPRSDIYSLGAVLHECLTGNDPSNNTPTPFNFPPLEMHDQPLPALLEPLIMQMLEMLPERRPANMTIVQQGLEQTQAALAKLEKRARASAPPTPPAPQAPPRPLVAPPLQAPVTTIAKSVPAVPAITTPRPFKITPLAIYHEHTAPVTSVAWSPDKRSIASASDDATVRVWEAASGATLYQPARRHSGPVLGVAWSPDRRYGASCGLDGRVQVWNARDGSHVYTYSGYAMIINALAWSPNGSQLALAKNSGRIQVLEATGGKSFEYKGHNSGVNSVAWSPDGQYIVSGDSSGTIRVWYAHDGSNYYDFTGHYSFGSSGSISALSWSPDGQFIASGESSEGQGRIQVWSLLGRKLLLVYPRHFQPITAIAWSPDGTRIASASRDRSVHVWGAHSGQQTIIYPNHNLAVTSVAWSPDGTRIVSGSEDKTVHIWEAKQNIYT